jgi:putative phage-type endonuclease
MQQGTAEWFEARRGKATASRMGDVTAKTKKGWGAGRDKYMAQLIGERLTGLSTSSYVSPAMRWGTENEAEARRAYDFYSSDGAMVTTDGFTPHPSIAMSGASVDGLVGERGLVEIKCPEIATHITTLLTEEIDDDYVLQMQWQMDCTGRDWCDFVSYDPRLPEQYRLFVKRVMRDDAVIMSLRVQVELFLSDLDEKLASLAKSYNNGVPDAVAQVDG